MLICVSKGVVSTAMCGRAHERKGGVTDTNSFERIQKIEEERGRKLQFSEYLQTLLLGQLCLAALQESEIKIKGLNISIIALP